MLLNLARCLAMVLAICAVNILHAEDWPQFRGGNGDGISTECGLPSEWGAEVDGKQQNVAWKLEIPGKGWSSPVLWHGKLYLTSAVPREGAEEGSGDLSLRAMCVDAKTGLMLWDNEIFVQDGKTAPKIHAKNSHASPTPLVDSNRVFVHFGHQGTACLDLDGKILWSTRELSYAPVHGNGCTPVLVDGGIVFSCDGGKDPFVVALEADTGKIKWKFARPGEPKKTFAFCTPTVISVNGKQQVISVGAGIVNALDPNTGEDIWHVKHGGYSVIPKPLFAHGLVYISTSYDSPMVMAIRPDGRGDVTESHVEWTLKKGAPHTPSLLILGKELYMVSDSGVATCVDALTGEQHWQERIGGNYSSSLVYADDKIYLQSEAGKAYVLKPGTTFEKPIETGFTTERNLSSYAVGDGALFIRTEKNLYRVQQPK
ncbi:PQQ-binding-like beta-propeller repeat protein [Anatilimnocola floriformis]|uniref:PQQ-binding-like beta-propeller repeat protein n=1 Tax=Anatilimnocola floriformis TaxID=2948575 RepID=UPI0020C4F999|nr:PQQ-binding-like beta-propeller repeat protein [Anatilimnocola floriformis]